MSPRIPDVLRNGGADLLGENKWVTQRVEAQAPSMTDVTSDSELLSLRFKHN